MVEVIGALARVVVARVPAKIQFMKSGANVKNSVRLSAAR